MAGYSGKPLFEKLGLKAGQSAHFINPPDSYRTELAPLKKSIQQKPELKGPLDFIHLFTASRNQLQKELPRLRGELDQKGCLWISWPKKASGVSTDLNENIVRDLGLAFGLVDIKVCAVDDTWSGLKFVYRLKDRK